MMQVSFLKAVSASNDLVSIACIQKYMLISHAVSRVVYPMP